MSSVREYNHVIRDLGRELDEALTEKIALAIQLVEHPLDKVQLSTLGAARPLGIAVRYLMETLPADTAPEKIVDALWEHSLRAAVVRACSQEQSKCTQQRKDKGCATS